MEIYFDYLKIYIQSDCSIVECEIFVLSLVTVFTMSHYSMLDSLLTSMFWVPPSSSFSRPGQSYLLLLPRLEQATNYFLVRHHCSHLYSLYMTVLDQRARAAASRWRITRAGMWRSSVKKERTASTTITTVWIKHQMTQQSTTAYSCCLHNTGLVNFWMDIFWVTHNIAKAARAEEMMLMVWEM